MSVVLPQGYENKVLTGDKLYYLIQLIKGALDDKADATALADLITTGDLADLLDGDCGNYTEDPADGIVYGSNGRFAEALANWVSTSFNPVEYDNLVQDIIDENNDNNDIAVAVDGRIDAKIGELSIPDELADLTADSTHRLVSDTEKSTWNGKQDALVFNTAYNATNNKVATMSDLPDISGKQDTLVFNTAYNASTNKVATMSDIPNISGKQDALVFNTAYNASSNKVATMADIPSVSGFQTASDVQSAITSAISGITSFSFEIVQALPQSNISQTTIYLVLKSSGSSGNIYTEYAYVKTGTDAQTGNDIYGWETLGDTQADIAVLSTAEITTIWNFAEEDPGL